jgi:hypothetical protein
LILTAKETVLKDKHDMQSYASIKMARVFEKVVSNDLKKRDISEINRDGESNSHVSEKSDNDIKRILPKMILNNARVHPSA